MSLPAWLEVVSFLERMVNLSVAKGPNMGYITADGALGSSVALPVSFLRAFYK